MASTNQKIEPFFTGQLCEVRNHGREERAAKYILSYEYRGGKFRDKKILARRPACSSCAASFARTNDLPIPPYTVTLKEKIKELKQAFHANETECADNSCRSLGVCICGRKLILGLIRLMEITYGL